MKIKATLGIGISNAHRTTIIEIPDEELEDMTEDEKSSYIRDFYVDLWMWECIDCGYEIIEGD